MSEVVHNRTERRENTASSMVKTGLTLSKGGRGGSDSGDLKECHAHKLPNQS
jgi:hypothetical protein